MISDRLEASTISIKSPENQDKLIDVLIKQTKKPEIKCNIINSYPYIKAKLFLEYEVLSSTYELDSDNFKENNLLEQEINSYIQEMVSSFLYKISHKYNVDLCNFENKLLENYLTLDEFEKVHWNEIYSDSYFDVEIKGDITSLGMFSQE